jgi:hypothetical protein
MTTLIDFGKAKIIELESDNVDFKKRIAEYTAEIKRLTVRQGEIDSSLKEVTHDFEIIVGFLSAEA